MRKKIEEYKILHEKICNFRIIHYAGFMYLGIALTITFQHNDLYVIIGGSISLLSMLTFFIIWGKLFYKFVKLRNEIGIENLDE